MSRQIAMSINVRDTWSREICRGVANYARQQDNWTLVLVDQGKLADHPPPDGLLGIFAKREAAYLDQVRRLGIPWINVSNHDPSSDAVSVHSDEGAIGRLAAHTLIDLGFRRFAFAGYASLAFSAGRKAGFTRALLQAGLGEPTLVEMHDDRATETLHALEKPVALFAASDNLAQRVIRSCLAQGIEVPSQLAVLGVDDDELMCEWSRITISSIKPNFQRVGFEAAAALHAMMDGRPAARRVTLVPPIGVVRRRSTDTLALDDPIVRDAVTLIRAHACRGLRVIDVAEALPISRRSLERRFTAAMGRSIHDEIHRVRLERGSQLLRSTEMTVLSVAMACGISDQRRFAAAFGKAYGMSPSAYRRANRLR